MITFNFKKNNIHFGIKAFIFSALFLASCGTAKKAVQSPLPPAKPLAETVTTAEIINTLQQSQPSFTTGNANKISLDVDFKGRQMTMSAVCQMVTDSAIHISIMPFMGIELFKLEMTPRGFVIIDKMNKRFFENTYAYFKNHFGLAINYETIQSLMSNRLFMVEKKAFVPADFVWKDGSPASHTLLASGEKTTQQIKLDDALLNRIGEVIIKAIDYNYVMTTTYSDFQTADDMTFPRQVWIKLEDNGEIKGTFNFNIQRIKFNDPITLKPTNLSRYTRGDLNDMFRK